MGVGNGLTPPVFANYYEKKNFFFRLGALAANWELLTNRSKPSCDTKAVTEAAKNSVAMMVTWGPPTDRGSDTEGFKEWCKLVCGGYPVINHGDGCTAPNIYRAMANRVDYLWFGDFDIFMDPRAQLLYP